jgi:hypothetical protein
LREKLVFLAVGWRGHCDARSGNWGALFVFEGATRRRDRALEYLHLPRIETQDFNGAEALRYV